MARDESVDDRPPLPVGADTARLQELARLGEVKRRKRLVWVLPVGVVAGLLALWLFSLGSQHPITRPALLVVTLRVVALILLCVGLIGFFRSHGWRWRSWYSDLQASLPIASGLEPRDRRAAARAVRRGAPNPDPTLRAVEIDWAWKQRRIAGQTLPMTPILASIGLLNIVEGQQIIGVCVLAIGAASPISLGRQARRTERYLDRAGTDDSLSG